MPSPQDILTDLYQLIETFAEQGQELDEETELVTDLKLDSVKVMNLMLQIEDHFDISIPLNVLPEIRTIKDLAAQIEELTRVAE
jgi:acyl carrier protein